MSQMRYWIARLKPIAHPSIGLSLLCAGVTGAFAWTAWQYPEIFSFASSEPNAEDAENAAIGADIDSLAFLTQSTRSTPLDAKAAQKPTDPATNPAKPEGEKPTTTTSLLGSNSFPILGGGPINLLNANGNNLALGGNSGNGMNTGMSNGISFQMDPPLQPSNPSRTWTQFPQTPIEGTTAVPANSLSNLQNSGIQTNGSPSNGSQSSGLQTNGLQTNGFQNNGLPVNNWNNPAQGTTGLPTNTPSISPNAYTNLTNPGFSSPGMPIDSGVAAPAGYGVPPIAPITPINNAPITPTVLPGADVPVQPLQPEQNFTAPRPLPGRVIGGGNINTFSNP